LVKESWNEAIEGRTPKALKVLDGTLEGTVKSPLRYSAARDVVNWTDPDRNKQKHEVDAKHAVTVHFVDDWRHSDDPPPETP